MQVFANYCIFSVTSQMHWNLPEVCSCGECACLMLLLSWVWNAHIRPAAPSSSGLLSRYPALLNAAALPVYGANPLPTQAGSVSTSTPGNIRDGYKELCVPPNHGELFSRVFRSF